MSREMRNECVSCGLPCLGSSCPNRNVPYLICDSCGDEDCEELYINDDGEEVCAECLLAQYTKITVDDVEGDDGYGF